MDSRILFSTTKPLLIVAPMQGVTDYVFRCAIEEIGGMDAFVSEYIVIANDNSYAKKALQDVQRTYREGLNKTPLIPQIISASAIGAIKVIKELAKDNLFSIDVNMGCPTKSVINRKCGAWHAENPQEALKLLKILRQEVPNGLSVKTRIGNQSTGKFNELLEALNESQCDFVTLHCRLATSNYNGEIRPDLAQIASQTLHMPLLYNGAITDPQTIDLICNKIGARGVMVGKGIMQNPWLLKQVKEFRKKGSFSTPNQTEFVSFYQKIYQNYVKEYASNSMGLRRVKQLIATFQHPHPSWAPFIECLFHSKNEKEMFFHLEAVSDDLLSTIGKSSNDAFGRFLSV